jgi:hypothetical protein
MIRRIWAASIAGVAYYQGVHAFAQGLRPKDCPYDLGRVEHGWWRRGFADARHADRFRRRALRRAGDYAAWPPRGAR